MCYNYIGLCAQNVDTILRSIMNTIGRVYIIMHIYKSNKIKPGRKKKCFIIISCSFSISTSILKFEMTVFVIDEYLQDVIISNPIQRPKFHVKLEVLTIGSHTLALL